MPGGSVALIYIWKTSESVLIYLRIIANSRMEFLNAVKESAVELIIRVAFFDRTVGGPNVTGNTSPGETRLFMRLLL